MYLHGESVSGWRACLKARELVLVEVFWSRQAGALPFPWQRRELGRGGGRAARRPRGKDGERVGGRGGGRDGEREG